MSRAALHPPLGEGYEQAGAATVEQEMGQEQQPRPTKKISAEHKSPQEHGIANFKIPTLERASNQPGEIYATSHMDGNEDATGIIYTRARHSPLPRADLTTHATLPTLQMRNDPTKTAPHQARPARYHSLGDGHERPQPDPKLLQGTVSQHGQKVPQKISIQNLEPVESTETHIQGLHSTQVRHHTQIDLLTCRVCFVKNMMIITQVRHHTHLDLSTCRVCLIKHMMTISGSHK